MPKNYLEAGVNIDLASSLVGFVAEAAKLTFSGKVLGGIGSFAGLYQLGSGEDPDILVACTDGVGSKLKLAYDYGLFAGIGQDLVAMCLNDLLCCGARPLFFLDYLAVEKLDLASSKAILSSIIAACLESETALLGGETAELPGMLPVGGYELAGFAVGIVKKSELLAAERAQAGDVLIGLASSGLHSNGYSLVRNLIESKKIDYTSFVPELGSELITELLKPTRLYNRSVSPLFSKLHSIAHITGGGILENLPRAFDPEKLTAEVYWDSWPKPKIFTWLQNLGALDLGDMKATFNMGLGLILVCPAENKDLILASLPEAYELGSLREKQAGDTDPVIFV